MVRRHTQSSRMTGTILEFVKVAVRQVQLQMGGVHVVAIIGHEVKGSALCACTPFHCSMRILLVASPTCGATMLGNESRLVASDTY